MRPVRPAPRVARALTADPTAVAEVAATVPPDNSARRVSVRSARLIARGCYVVQTVVVAAVVNAPRGSCAAMAAASLRGLVRANVASRGSVAAAAMRPVFSKAIAAMTFAAPVRLIFRSARRVVVARSHVCRPVAKITAVQTVVVASVAFVRGRTCVMTASVALARQTVKTLSVVTTAVAAAAGTVTRLRVARPLVCASWRTPAQGAVVPWRAIAVATHGVSSTAGVARMSVRRARLTSSWSRRWVVAVASRPVVRRLAVRMVAGVAVGAARAVIFARTEPAFPAQPAAPA